MSNLHRFDDFVLDEAKRTLFRAETPVFLTPRALDVLIFLTRNPKRLVTKEELLEAVWGEAFVEEGNLTQYISHLRKALGDNSQAPRLIVTIARKGYQFTGDVTVSEGTNDTKQAAAQTALTEPPRANSSAANELQIRGAKTPKVVKLWRTVAITGVLAVILIVVGYETWPNIRGTLSPRSEKIMLAVLPFENLTGDPNKEYLADGLTEEMISQLSRLNPEQLRVIGRTSVMGYKHKNERLDQIGRDLSVQYVLENSLRESGDHLRITAQLTQVNDQTHVWSQDYDYPAKDIVKVEDDVGRAVAREIGLHLTSQQQAELVRQRPANPEAYDAYMQGYYFFERDTDEDTNWAAKSYERAVQLDSSYAPAWVGLSRSRHWQVVRGLIPSDEGRRLAREAVVRALELNPNLATAHLQMGRIKRQDDYDWAGADASTQRALALEPGNPEVLRLAAFSALIVGRFDQALPLNRRSVELDPLNAESWGTLGETEFFMEQLGQAEVSFKKSIELRPDQWQNRCFLDEAYILQGRPQDALPEIDRVHQNLRDWGLYLYAIAYHALGRRKESDAAVTELIAKYHGVDEYLIAQVYAFRNEPDKAFEWLDRGYARHNDGLIETKISPLLKNLHSDPRYAALLKKLNLPN